MIIKAISIGKIYHVPQKGPGLFSRSKKEVAALTDVTFTVDSGDLIGLVGENGAGKSTLIKIMTGVIAQTSGEISVLSSGPMKNRKQNANKIGLMMGQRSQLWWDLPAKESFELYRRMYGVSVCDYNRIMNEIDELVSVKSFYERPVRTLSLGQRMRCELGVSLLHRPELLFLDEPTIGVDTLAKERLLTFISSLKERFGTTVILTSHDLGDIAKVSNKMIILDKGRVIYNGETSNLSKYDNHRYIEVQYAEVPLDQPSDDFPFTVLDDNKLRYCIDNDSAKMRALLARVFENNNVIDVSISSSKIEDVIKKMYEGQRHD